MMLVKGMTTITRRKPWRIACFRAKAREASVLPRPSGRAEGGGEGEDTDPRAKAGGVRVLRGEGGGGGRLPPPVGTVRVCRPGGRSAARRQSARTSARNASTASARDRASTGNSAARALAA